MPAPKDIPIIICSLDKAGFIECVCDGFIAEIGSKFGNIVFISYAKEVSSIFISELVAGLWVREIDSRRAIFINRSKQVYFSAF